MFWLLVRGSYPLFLGVLVDCKILTNLFEDFVGDEEAENRYAPFPMLFVIVGRNLDPKLCKERYVCIILVRDAHEADISVYDIHFSISV